MCTRSLLVVGGGLFGSLAATCARSKGIEATVFDSGLTGAASPAAAGLFKEAWAGKKLQEHYRRALALLERLFEVRTVSLQRDDDSKESLLFVPPAAILEVKREGASPPVGLTGGLAPSRFSPIRQQVTAVGDGWLEAAGQRHEGWVYIAAGIWSAQFLPGLAVSARAGAAFLFAGERPGRLRVVGPSRQALAFVRDPGTTYFSDGTAERDYTPLHDRQTLERAVDLGCLDSPQERLWGCRPYTPGGPVFQKLGNRTWLATGGRKMGTILGASLACRLIEEELTR